MKQKYLRIKMDDDSVWEVAYEPLIRLAIARGTERGAFDHMSQVEQAEHLRWCIEGVKEPYQVHDDLMDLTWAEVLSVGAKMVQPPPPPPYEGWWKETHSFASFEAVYREEEPETKDDTPFFEPFWKPGGVVKLKQPHKPQTILTELRRHIADMVIASKQRGLDRPPFYAKEELLVLQRQHAYREEWKGFTHGIIVGEVSREDGQVTSVSLSLYDPTLSVIYCDLPTGVPTYVDFTVDELIPLRAHVIGN